MKPARATLFRACAVIGAAAVTAAGLTGCGSEEKQEYTVPNALCGISVPAEDLAPFLPAGKKITVEERDPENEYGWMTGCLVAVDGEEILATTVEWKREGSSTGEFARGVSLEKTDHLSDDGHFLWSGRQGFGRTECTNPKGTQRLFTAVRPHSSEHEDSDAMERIIKAYTKAVEKSDLCESAGEL